MSAVLRSGRICAAAIARTNVARRARANHRSSRRSVSGARAHAFENIFF